MFEAFSTATSTPFHPISVFLFLPPRFFSLISCTYLDSCQLRNIPWSLYSSNTPGNSSLYSDSRCRYRYYYIGNNSNSRSFSLAHSISIQFSFSFVPSFSFSSFHCFLTFVSFSPLRSATVCRAARPTITRISPYEI